MEVPHLSDVRQRERNAMMAILMGLKSVSPTGLHRLIEERKVTVVIDVNSTMGYTHVQVMSAGISGWLAARMPVQSGNVR